MSKNISSLQNPPQRIHFRVVGCTSSDNGYQSNQLQRQSPDSKGWVSQRFCTYPQIIIVDLIDPALIQKLTFLSHQSKITTKIDIQCKQDNVQSWKKLGYTCMQSNITTNYQARQLRTVKLNKQLVKLLKFTLYSNYINPLNVFNQVSLIAVSVYGERLHPKPLDDMKQKGVLPPGAILDKETLDKLRELQYLKRQAIDNNDFEKASQLKQQIDKLKSGVQALSILQRQKREAIRRQDYDQAKVIYEKMRKIRGPIPRNVVSSNERYDDYFNKSNQYQRNKQTFTPVVNNLKNKQNKSVSFDESGGRNQQVDSPIQQLKKSMVLPNANKIKNKPIINFDQIRVGPKNGGGNVFDNNSYLQQQQQKYQPNSKSQKITKKNPSANQNADNPKFARNKIKLPPSQRQVQQPLQEQQNGQNFPRQCQQYFTIIPQLTFKNLFSNNKNLRQHALDQVLVLVDQLQHQEYLQKLFINAVIFIVKNTINDKVISILLKTLILLGMTFKEYKPKLEQISRQNLKNIKFILSKLSEYIGHSNDQLKSQSEDAYIILPKYSKATSKQLCIQTITLTENIDRLPRTIIAKLQMLGKLIRKYDQQSLNNSKDKKKQKYEDVIQYAKRYLEDKNNQVRNTSIRLLVFLAKIIGKQELLKSLQDVRQSTIKIIEDKLYGRNNDDQNNIVNNSSRKPSPQRNSPRVMSPKRSPPQSMKREESPPKQIYIKSPLAQKKQFHTVEKQTQLNNAMKPKQKYNPRTPEYECEYCEQFDKRFQNQNFRDIHLFKVCKMITLCKQCNQCVEIQSLNHHLLQQCQKKKFYKKCPRCKEPVLAKQFNLHVQRKGCIPSKAVTVANRCPLCHEDIHPKKQGWIKHLKEQGCPCQRDRAR